MANDIQKSNLKYREYKNLMLIFTPPPMNLSLNLFLKLSLHFLTGINQAKVLIKFLYT